MNLKFEEFQKLNIDLKELDNIRVKSFEKFKTFQITPIFSAVLDLWKGLFEEENPRVFPPRGLRYLELEGLELSWGF